jgi:hypothetical protein
MFLFVMGCTNNQTPSGLKQGGSPSFAFDKMVTWGGNTYVATDEQIDGIGHRIGKVIKNSNKEAESLPSGFSNHFKVGTVLYSIPGVDIEEAIGIEDLEDHYIKAVNVRHVQLKEGIFGVV